MYNYHQVVSLNLQRILVTLIILMLILMIIPQPVQAKPCWLIPVQYEAVIQKWEIDTSGNITLSSSGPLMQIENTGMAVDNETNTLFIAHELSHGIEVMNGTTLLSYGIACAELYDSAGITVDSVSNLVYVFRRSRNLMYVYHYDDITPWLLTAVPGYPVTLSDLNGASGIAVDNLHERLYISDFSASVNYVRVYDTTTWSLVQSIEVPVNPMGIAVDRVRGYVYVTSPDTMPPEGRCLFTLPAGINSTLLCKYDLNTGSSYTVDMGHGGMGLAVDEVTGYVYVTRGCNGVDVQVYSSTLGLRQTTVALGGPAGIAIPQYPESGEIMGINRVVGVSVATSSTRWNNLIDAAIGDGVINGISAGMGYVFDPNASTYNRLLGDVTYGARVQVTKTPSIGGIEQYCVTRTNIDPNTITLTFGFTSALIEVSTPTTNTADVVIDWLGETAVAPAANTAGDDLLPPGISILFDSYAVTGFGVKAMSGIQGIQIRAFH